MNNEKVRYWTFILYPESAPEDWRDILQSLGLEFGISPLHDKDINPTGEVKKAHYHILMCYNGPTTYNRALSICKMVNATIPQRVYSPKGIIRYFTHQDNPEKYQYNKEDITTLNGLDISNFEDLTEKQILQIKKDIIKFINENNVKSYSKLVNIYAYDITMIDYFRVLSQNTIFFNAYLKSRKEDFIDEIR